MNGTSRCLFSDKYETHKYSVDRTYNCWMLKCWFIMWPVGFKRLRKAERTIHFHKTYSKKKKRLVLVSSAHVLRSHWNLCTTFLTLWWLNIPLRWEVVSLTNAVLFRQSSSFLIFFGQTFHHKARVFFLCHHSSKLAPTVICVACNTIVSSKSATL